MLGDVRKQIADLRSALTVLLKLPWAGKSAANIVELSGFNLSGERLSVVFVQATCDTPPSIYKNMTLRALASKWVFFGSRSPSASVWPSMPARATEPKPTADLRSISRRVPFC